MLRLGVKGEGTSPHLKLKATTHRSKLMESLKQSAELMDELKKKMTPDIKKSLIVRPVPREHPFVYRLSRLIPSRKNTLLPLIHLKTSYKQY